MLDKPEIGSPCNGCGVCCVNTVCGSGSYALGLVTTWGEHAKGPCPALVDDGEKFVCGVMLRPNDWLKAARSPTTLRQAFGLLIGVGLGCDDSGDEPDETAQPKIDELTAIYMARHPVEQLRLAADIVMDRHPPKAQSYTAHILPSAKTMRHSMRH